MKTDYLSDLLARVRAEMTVKKRNGKTALSLSWLLSVRGVTDKERRFMEEYRQPIIEYLRRKADFERAEAELTERLQKAVGGARRDK